MYVSSSVSQTVSFLSQFHHIWDTNVRTHTSIQGTDHLYNVTYNIIIPCYHVSGYSGIQTQVPTNLVRDASLSSRPPQLLRAAILLPGPPGSPEHAGLRGSAAALQHHLCHRGKTDYVRHGSCLGVCVCVCVCGAHMNSGFCGCGLRQYCHANSLSIYMCIKQAYISILV